MTRVLGVIPARAGSKGVPGKNLRALGGKPLIAHVIAAAQATTLLDRWVVSTESEEIARVARTCGADVPFLRPVELAQDDVSLIPVVQHAMAHFDGVGWRADVVVSLQPTCPFTTGACIDQAVQKALDTGCEAVVTVTRIERYHPFRAMRVEGDRVLPLTEYTSERYLQRQDRPPAYAFTGALYVRRRELLERWNARDFALGADVRGIVTDALSSVDINTPLDFLLAEAVLHLRRKGTDADWNVDAG